MFWACLVSLKYILDLNVHLKLCIEATSGEFFTPEDENSVIVFMPEGSRTHMGGTMRLGLRPTIFSVPALTSSPNTPSSTSNDKPSSKVRALYGGAEKVWERHRHRYEVNPKYVAQLEASGMRFVGRDERGERMQIMELDGSLHPYFAGLQAHPEFCSRPLNPSPPFLGFIAAASGAQELAEQCEAQMRSFVPPHPPGAMVDEESIKRMQAMGGKLKGIMALSQSNAHVNEEKLVNGDAKVPNGA